MSRLDTLQKMLLETPDDEFLLYAIALEYQKQGDSEGAIEQMNKLIAIHENYLPVYYQLGHLYAQKGDREYAMELFRKGIEIAKHRGDRKTIGELNEALMILEE
jgi:tetratricopeptide (TPR) repeat protein